MAVGPANITHPASPPQPGIRPVTRNASSLAKKPIVVASIIDA